MSESTLGVLCRALDIALEDSGAVHTALSDTLATGDVEAGCEAGDALGLGLDAATLGISEVPSLWSLTE